MSYQFSHSDGFEPINFLLKNTFFKFTCIHGNQKCYIINFNFLVKKYFFTPIHSC